MGKVEKGDPQGTELLWSECLCFPPTPNEEIQMLKPNPIVIAFEGGAFGK